MSHKIAITALPKSWWAAYTEALLNSRGRKTEFQQWRERMDLQSRFLRDVEQTWFEHYSTNLRPGDVITIEGISTKRPMRYQP